MRCRYLLALALTVVAPVAMAQEIVGDAIPKSLTGQPGDAARGRAIVANRSVGLCLLCHSGPIAEERMREQLAYPKSRLSEILAQLWSPTKH